MPALIDSRKIIVRAIKKPSYRSILNTCLLPSGVGLIWGDLPGKKLTWDGIKKICKWLVAADLLQEIPPDSFNHKKTKYLTTDKGKRLLEKYPSRTSPIQYIVGVEIPRR